MATRWTFWRSSLTAPRPEPLFRLNGSVVFTRDYVKHRLLSKKPYGQGTQGIITKIHPGPLGEVTHLDVRLPKGEFLREVPIDYFQAWCREHASGREPAAMLFLSATFMWIPRAAEFR
jgi:hypothetical protein